MTSTENRVADVDVAQPVATATNNNQTENLKGNDKPKKRREIAPVWKVVKEGSKKFAAQLEKHKNPETKRECLNECVSKHYQDRLRFWQDFRTQSDRLVDSKKFEKCCTSRGLDVQTVAEHVVFEGSVVLNRVIRYGVDAILGERIMMFKKPIYNDENKLYVQSAEGKEQDGAKKSA